MGKESKKSSKHSKKESKKKDKKKKIHKDKDSSSGNDLTSLLSWGLLNHPKLLQDLPAIVIALDKGEYVNIQNISNKSEKEILQSIMQLLPLLNDPNNGWYKNSASVSVSSFILQDLLTSNSIKQPTGLSYSDKISSQSAPFLILTLINKFPSLKNELPSLFSTLIDGSAIQLDFIENEDIREGLEKIFKCLELIEEEDGFIIPDGKKHEVILEAVQQINDVFVLEASMGFNNKTVTDESKGGESSHITVNNTNECDNNQEDDSSDSSEDEKEPSDESVSEDEDEKESDTLIQRHAGPTMPTREQLKEAQRIAASMPPPQTYLDEDDVDDDDDVGPKMYDSSKDPLLKLQREELLAQPLGFVGLDMDYRKNRIFGGGQTDNNDLNEGMEGQEEKEVTEREEWILTPGDSKAIADLGSSLNANRKFQTGKLAKKAVEQLSFERDMRLKHQSSEETEESLRTKKIMEEFREKRGPTLMEAHLDKQSKKQKPESGIRRPFDREKDVLSRKKLDHFQVSKLVENAKEIDSRFDKGSVQKSFL